MRKNTARHWLHAALDLLPVILIPVFMIYSHRHDVAQDFEVVEQEPVYYETNEVTRYEDLYVDHIYSWNDNHTFDWAPAQTGNLCIIYPTYNLTFITNLNDVTSISFRYASDSKLFLYVTYNDNNALWVNVTNRQFDFVIKESRTQFNYFQYLINDISSSDLLVVKDYQDVVTTIPKDVMTSFMDRFNNSIDKYFNMGNVFNLKDVYHWFEVNIFNNNPPVVMASIYNIIVYEFVMDLLFLLYGLFMWFVDMLKRLIEKPINSIK